MTGARSIRRVLVAEGNERAIEIQVSGGSEGPSTVRWTEAGRVVDAIITPLPDGGIAVEMEGVTARARVSVSGSEVWVHLRGRTALFSLARPGARSRAASQSDQGPEVRSPMTGTVRRVDVLVGDLVHQGQPLVALEAMKMEHLMKSPRAARIEEIRCREGEAVDAGQVLIRLGPP